MFVTKISAGDTLRIGAHRLVFRACGDDDIAVDTFEGPAPTVQVRQPVTRFDERRRAGTVVLPPRCITIGRAKVYARRLEGRKYTVSVDAPMDHKIEVIRANGSPGQDAPGEPIEAAGAVRAGV